MTNYIVAIDLGTSHLTGIVGEKHNDGTFTIVACETERPLSCMSRGTIRNLDDTARHVGQLVKKLESSLSGGYIDRVYVGVGGQSLRSVTHIEAKDVADGKPVGKEDLDVLKEQCEKYKPDLLDVLDVVPTGYYLDGRRETNPIGVPCKRLEAHFKLIVGRPSIRRNIIESINVRAKKEIAGVVVSPLALADAMLSKDEKELGCALVDFGAGVTTVTVYKNGDLLHLSVIPFGGNLITHDVVTLELTETEAEKLKISHGSAVLQKEDDEKTVKIEMESSEREIGVNDLNAIIEARAKEIVANIHARISETIEPRHLSAGIVLAGGASELRRLPDLITEQCKAKVRHSAIRSGLVRGSDDSLGNPLYLTAISIMLKGSEQCVSQPAAITPEKEADAVQNGDKPDNRDVNIPDPEIKHGGGVRGDRNKNGKNRFGWIKSIFDEE